MKQPAGLISVLLDTNADQAERDDAAMDLASYDHSEAAEALAKVAAMPETPDMVLASCGESLAEIWVRKGAINFEQYEVLRSQAKKEANAYINSKQPALFNS